MTINPHLTDQLLAGLDNIKPHADCDGECATERASRQIAESLSAALPGIDPKLIGEIALHIGDAINSVILGSHNAGNTWKQSAASAVVVSLEAGALLYRGQATS